MAFSQSLFNPYTCYKVTYLFMTNQTVVCSKREHNYDKHNYGKHNSMKISNGVYKVFWFFIKHLDQRFTIS